MAGKTFDQLNAERQARWEAKHGKDEEAVPIKESEDLIVRFTLEDSVILATDKNKEALLRLEIMVENQPVRIRFPGYGLQDAFTKEFSQLLIELSGYAANIEIPIDMMELVNNHTQSREGFMVWATIMAATLQSKGVVKKIEHLIFAYLRPTMNDKPLDVEWARKNFSIDEVVRMFFAIVCVDQWIKKNAIFGLAKIFQVWVKAESSVISPTKPASISSPYNNSQPYKFVSFSDETPNIRMN